jgi:hypothetical protein
LAARRSLRILLMKWGLMGLRLMPAALLA